MCELCGRVRALRYLYVTKDRLLTIRCIKHHQCKAHLERVLGIRVGQAIYDQPALPVISLAVAARIERERIKRLPTATSTFIQKLQIPATKTRKASRQKHSLCHKRKKSASQRRTEA